MAADNATTADESLDVITDALLTASRLLMAISARSIGEVDETITIPQFRTLVILSNRGPINLATLAGLLGVQPSATGRLADRLPPPPRRGGARRPPGGRYRFVAAFWPDSPPLGGDQQILPLHAAVGEILLREFDQ